eukprot:scaffold382427_cov32-Prasinocladus_malaysianus.AAC.1
MQVKGFLRELFVSGQARGAVWRRKRASGSTRTVALHGAVCRISWFGYSVTSQYEYSYEYTLLE